MVNKESKLLLDWMSLKDDSEIEYSLRLGLVIQNFSCGSGWCGSGSVNVQFDVNLATTAGRG